MKKSENDMNVFEFMRGQADCKKGIPHRDQGEDYNRGYQDVINGVGL